MHTRTRARTDAHPLFGALVLRNGAQVCNCREVVGAHALRRLERLTDERGGDVRWHGHLQVAAEVEADVAEVARGAVAARRNAGRRRVE
eukprot:361329-Chlamydomonas_euryale.AAC.3